MGSTIAQLYDFDTTALISSRQGIYNPRVFRRNMKEDGISMNITKTKLSGVLITEPRIFEDHRGHFLETYHAERYREAGNLSLTFVQDNISNSTRNVLRGLHYQLGRPQAKLVMALSGKIFDVAVDIRRNSPTFGQWLGITLSSENYRQIFIPEGFAHGFCVLSETATVFYKCSDYYAPQEERGIVWNDPGLAIEWPVVDANISKKDARYPTLDAVPRNELPIFRSLS